jgi:hypothetical protein
MAFTFSITKNLIPQLRQSIVDKSTNAVRDNAHFMQGYAGGIAPVRTGAFRVSIYVNGPDGESDYSERAGLAESANPNAHITPELQAATADPRANGAPRDQATGRFTYPQAIVASAVEYSLYLEEGTWKMSPRPTFRPAALATEFRFLTDMTQVASGF